MNRNKKFTKWLVIALSALLVVTGVAWAVYRNKKGPDAADAASLSTSENSAGAADVSETETSTAAESQATQEASETIDGQQTNPETGNKGGGESRPVTGGKEESPSVPASSGKPQAPVTSRPSAGSGSKPSSAPPPIGSSAPIDSASSYNDSYANQVLVIVNQERAKEGLAPLSMNQGAVAAAKVRAREIVTVFSHTRPSGDSCFTALNEAGVRYTMSGENIAQGYRTPEKVMAGWMSSPGHAANILNGRFTEIGIACYVVGGNYYWVQMFLTP